MNWLQIVRDWAEVWALLIPLSVIILFRPVGPKISWLIAYVFLGFFLNASCTVMAQFNGSMPAWLKNNNFLYNIHSVARVLLFSFYILGLLPSRLRKLLHYLLLLYTGFIVVNFTCFESPFFVSPNLFAAESIVLLIVCLSFFFRSIQDESETRWLKHPSFLLCTGICFYEVVTFFVFLFFNTINYSTKHRDIAFAKTLQLIYTISYIMLCILLAGALYKVYRRESSASRT